MFHRQPLKSLYLVYFGLKTLVKLPLWILSSILLPSSRPDRIWSLRTYLSYNFIRDLMQIVPMLQLRMFPFNIEVPDGAYKNCKFVWVPGEKMENVEEPVRSFAQRSGVGTETVSGFWYFKEGHYSSKIKEPSSDEKVVFLMHGGAFFHGSARPTDIYALISNGITKYSHSVNRLFSLDFRRCSAAPAEPKNPFPAALLDAIAGYRYLLSLGFLPENVIMIGDSSGGNLALALVRYIKEAEPAGLPAPSRMILLSPWADPTHSRNEPGSSLRVNPKYDFLSLSSEYATYSLRAYLGTTWTLNEAQLNPYIACTSSKIEPKQGEYRNYPKTLVVAGELEMIKDDVIRIADYLKRDNPQSGHVTLCTISGATHDILIFDFAEPQHTETLLKVVQWIDDQ